MKIFVFWFICCTAYASDLSLMLSPEEEAALARAQEQANKGPQQTKELPHTLRLDGIIYSHPKSWTIWLNGRSIKAGESIDALHILNVTPETIEIVWNPKPDQRHQICLRPHEIFQGPTLQISPVN